MILHFSHIGLTEARTFIAPDSYRSYRTPARPSSRAAGTIKRPIGPNGKDSKGQAWTSSGHSASKDVGPRSPVGPRPLLQLRPIHPRGRVALLSAHYVIRPAGRLVLLLRPRHPRSRCRCICLLSMAIAAGAREVHFDAQHFDLGVHRRAAACAFVGEQASKRPSRGLTPMLGAPDAPNMTRLCQLSNQREHCLRRLRHSVSSSAMPPTSASPQRAPVGRPHRLPDAEGAGDRGGEVEGRWGHPRTTPDFRAPAPAPSCPGWRPSTPRPRAPSSSGRAWRRGRGRRRSLGRLQP
jgi:hypothetical protein